MNKRKKKINWEDIDPELERLECDEDEIYLDYDFEEDIPYESAMEP
jgi:hypothetical protein